MTEAQCHALGSTYSRIRIAGYGDNTLFAFKEHVEDLKAASGLPFREMFHALRTMTKAKGGELKNAKYAEYFGGMKPADWNENNFQSGPEIEQWFIDAAHEIVFDTPISPGGFIRPSQRDGFISSGGGSGFLQFCRYAQVPDYFAAYGLVVMGKGWRMNNQFNSYGGWFKRWLPSNCKVNA